MKRTVLALLALVCLVAFTLPSVASAESPPTDIQVRQDYQENVTANAERQPIIAATAEREVDIGACAVTRARNSQIVVTTPAQGYESASGRVATNELPQPENMAGNNCTRKARDASPQRVARE